MRTKLAMLFLLAVQMTYSACANAEPTPTPSTASTTAATPTATALPTETAQPPADTPAPEPTPLPVASPEATPPDTSASLPDAAPLVNDEGGVVNITGVVTYTNPFFTLGVAAPLVILEDQAGFVDRNESFLMPVESQTLGQITSDFFNSPFSYNVSLPIEPQGTPRDVDHDGVEEIGVQIFAIAYWNNTFGDPFLEERDLGGGGWSTAYASTRISEEAAFEKEIVGGKLLVYSPDGNQGFPSGFGEDGLLFTEDDPTVTLPQGYTLVDLDSTPFLFDRSRDQVVDLIEPEGAALVDYSEMGYTEAFESLVSQLSREYAFTEYKGIDWKALQAELQPQFAEAEERGDAGLYREALRDFAWSIPDGHVQGPFLIDQFRLMAGGGVGMAVRELDDGRVVVTYLLAGGSADLAGIQLGAEIVAINGVPMADHISGVVSHFGPYSTAHAERLDKQLFSTRFPIGMDVEAAFVNPGESQVQTADLTVTGESESFNIWFEDAQRDGFELPVEYELLEEGIGYVQILSFSDNDLLTVQLWERMIRAMNENDVPAIIVDMRQNGGGRGFLADQMAAYFFDEPLTLGNTGSYDADREEFYFDPDGEGHFFLPTEDLRYRGELVVLVGPDCASACEFFSFDLTLQDRATVIGHYPTAGLGGSIDQVAMPEDETFTFTQGRAVDPQGNIHIEGIGVVPDIQVPVTAESVLGEGDAVLDAALLYLLGSILDGGELSIGDQVTDSLAPDSKIRFALSLSLGQQVSIILEADKEMYLGFYDQSGEFLGSREGRLAALESFDVPLDFVLIVEVAVLDGSGVDAFSLSIEGE